MGGKNCSLPRVCAIIPNSCGRGAVAFIVSTCPGATLNIPMGRPRRPAAVAGPGLGVVVSIIPFIFEGQGREGLVHLTWELLPLYSGPAKGAVVVAEAEGKVFGCD